MKSEKKRETCNYNGFKRSRYFHGQLMTDRDFREEQIYHNEKRKLLNRMLHGWGVVCGLEIEPVKEKKMTVRIGRGLAIDAAGNEIYLDESYELDLSETIGSSGQASGSDVCAENEEKKTENRWYIVLKYKEVPTDPVPVYTPGSECEEKACDYSRIEEGYCIELSREGCTASNEQTLCETLNPNSDSGDFREKFCNGLLLPCPPEECGEEGVVLGSVTFDDPVRSQTVITEEMINNWDCRRYVITFELLQYWMRRLGSERVPLEAIVKYSELGCRCRSEEGAKKLFNDICLVTVPNVVHENIKAAKNIIEKNSLKIGDILYVTEFDPPFKPGDVMRQDPIGGKKVKKGSSVKLWVCKKNEWFPADSVTHIPGIGKIFAEKLKAAGIEKIADLAKADPKRIAEILKIKPEKAKRFVTEAKRVIRQ